MFLWKTLEDAVEDVDADRSFDWKAQTQYSELRIKCARKFESSTEMLERGIHVLHSVFQQSMTAAARQSADLHRSQP